MASSEERSAVGYAPVVAPLAAAAQTSQPAGRPPSPRTARPPPKNSPWVFTREQLSDSPSRRDGLDEATEKQYRDKTTKFMQKAGDAIKMCG